ncbi:SDR family NAD(P)-dependent oxidoreductase [Actinomadura rupiterrae]|uniref:SDR family NAD(P)-dependent oxidoreductase n=1 Tax=Actinomadura rupiterrae TaxID=559627 RepID=UPI0020A5552B|nr:SDR family oxidoreductase [Actinomadura rupiterrae]MCP2340341.1 NAD(P)-dependent dehydrogenase (short-subunit alcohol dehydrogenase family) [Actinomadura rupiterrae]
MDRNRVWAIGSGIGDESYAFFKDRRGWHRERIPYASHLAMASVPLLTDRGELVVMGMSIGEHTPPKYRERTVLYHRAASGKWHVDMIPAKLAGREYDPWGATALRGSGTSFSAVPCRPVAGPRRPWRLTVPATETGRKSWICGIRPGALGPRADPRAPARPMCLAGVRNSVVGMSKTALITGASKGLGRALAADLARDGWTVVIDARSADELAKAAAEIGPNAVAVPGDVTDPAHRDALVRAVEAAGGLDLLVNNAGTLGTTPLPLLADQPLDDLQDAFRTNVTAPLALVQAFLPDLRARRGAILNITSDAAVEGYQTWGGYGSTKAALEQLSHVLAAEEPDVAVWWADPGSMNTDMLRASGEDADAAPQPATVAAALLSLVSDRRPSGRYRADDLARPTSPRGDGQ